VRQPSGSHTRATRGDKGPRYPSGGDVSGSEIPEQRPLRKGRAEQRSETAYLIFYVNLGGHYMRFGCLKKHPYL
jgi:hypothetical protein